MTTEWKALVEGNHFTKNFFSMSEWKSLSDKHPGWRQFIKRYIKDPHFIKFFGKLKKELKQDVSDGVIIHPPPSLIFNTLKSCSLQDIRVVILGQDCYIKRVNIKKDGELHRIPQAMGFAFSVPDGATPPPSLKNIYKELVADPDVNLDVAPKSGNLTKWVEEEGVFLFNCALTVQEGKSNSHAHLWQDFSNWLIDYISANTENVVFILLGTFAHSKAKLVDTEKHCIIKAGHPSPLNRTTPFVGSRVFSKANIYLNSMDKKEVCWENL